MPQCPCKRLAAIDENMLDASRILMWGLERGLVKDFLGREYHNVSTKVEAQIAAIGKA